MSYIAKEPESYVGKIVGTGQCVAFVKTAAGAPTTSMWKEGTKVHGTPLIPSGTAVATFVDGKYPNRSTGNHAAIFINQDAGGMWVYDQWLSHPVTKRKISWHGKHGPNNDGDAF